MDFSELKKFPWNPEIYLAQQGDTKAMRRTCAKAEPIVDQFGKVSYFVNLLGKDEVRSIASLSLVEFVMSYPGGVPDEEVPALIKQAIKCDLINSVHRLEYRRGKEEAPPTNADTGSPENSSGDTGSPENSSGDTGSPSAPPYGEPEACLLQNAYAQTVQDAIQHLNRNEQTVIQFYYFRQETTNEIAVRLGCSVQNVRKIKRRALTRLRSLLER